MITQAQYERLPEVAKQVVAYQRRIDDLLFDDVIPISAGKEFRRLKQCRDEAAKGMAGLYGKAKTKDGTAPVMS